MTDAALAKDVRYAFVLQGVGFGASYLLNVVLARWLGTHGFGEYSFVRNWVILIGTLGTMGTFGAALKFIPLYRLTDNWRSLRGFILFSTLLTIAATGMFQAVISAVLFVFPPLGFDPGIIIVGLGIAVFFALHTLYTDVLRALGYVIIAIAPADVVRPLLIMILTAAGLAAFKTPSVLIALGALFAGTVMIMAYQIGITARHIARHSRENGYDIHTREWKKFSLDTLIFRAAITLRSELPAILIGFLGGGTAVGLFTVASRAAMLTSFLFAAVRRVFEPLITPHYATGQIRDLHILHARVTRWTFWASITAASMIVLFANPLLRVFGDDFLAAQPTLLILVMGQIINAATGQAGSLLRYTQHETTARSISLYALLIVTAGTLIFTPLWGAEGAAIAVSIAVIYQNLALYRAAWRTLGIYLPWRTFLPFGRLE